MTENKKIFCEGVARLCKAAGCPELFAPIVKIASLCEAGEQQNANTTIANVDLSKLPQEELDSLQAEITKAAEAKKAVTDAETAQETAEENVDTAKQAQTEINANLANKLNATAAQAEKDAEAEKTEENA